MDFSRKRFCEMPEKIIFTIETPLLNCAKFFKKIVYDERFALIDFPSIIEQELGKDTALSKHHFWI